VLCLILYISENFKGVIMALPIPDSPMSGFKAGKLNYSALFDFIYFRKF